MLTRRCFGKLSFTTFIGFSLGRPGVVWAKAGFSGLKDAFVQIEAESGGRLGVTALDTATGAAAGHRADERFPLCSTVKLLIAAAILAKVDAGREQLARHIDIAPGDLQEYAPVTRKHVNGAMSVSELCDAAITLSDNTAANLLIASLGGPGAVTQYARTLGDDATRLDRIEPELNEAAPGDPRDTTTPAAMARNIAALATGNSLSAGSREQLVGWLVGNKTGDARLRAGFPSDWRIGDKTGSGERGTTNDVGVIWPPGRAPLIVAAYLTGTAVPPNVREATLAAVARAVAAAAAG